MAEWVLDSSAILAFVNQEPGGDEVGGMLAAGAVSANNLAEIVSKFWDRGISPDDIEALVDAFDFQVHEVDRALAIDIGALRPLTRQAGLSLGDRSCLALARRLNCPAVTADRAWFGLQLDGIEIRHIR